MTSRTRPPPLHEHEVSLMNSHDTPPTGGSGRRVRRSKTMRRITGGLALLFALTAIGFAYSRVRRRHRKQAHAAERRRRADRRGQADLPDRVHHLPRREPAGCRRTAARHWSVSARPPPTSRCPAAGCRPPRTARRSSARSRSSTPSETDALAAYIQANGGGPVIPDGDLRAPRPDRPGRRAVPAQLRVLPQLHRSGRRALAGQVRPQPRPGHRPADLRRHAQRPAEHAEVR